MIEALKLRNTDQITYCKVKLEIHEGLTYSKNEKKNMVPNGKCVGNQLTYKNE